jgi:chromosome segregation ATPase
MNREHWTEAQDVSAEISHYRRAIERNDAEIAAIDEQMDALRMRRQALNMRNTTLDSRAQDAYNKLMDEKARNTLEFTVQQLA